VGAVFIYTELCRTYRLSWATYGLACARRYKRQTTPLP